MGRKKIYRTNNQLKKAHQEAVNKYAKKTFRAYTIRFRLDKDKDIINKLDSETNKADYLRDLIQKDIEQS
jgi:hypothetical protein